MAILVFLLATSISLVSSQISFSFPGNISNNLILQGAAQNESQSLVFKPPPLGSNFTSVFYYGFLQNINSQLAFSSNFTFQMLGGSHPFGFSGFMTAYNFPVCGSNSLTIRQAKIYTCEQFVVAFNLDGENKISLLSTRHNQTLALVHSRVNLTSGSTLQAWIEYHRAPHLDSLRVWVAEAGAPQPVTPDIDHKLTYPGNYFFPGFIGCYNTNSSNCVQLVTSWSLSIGAMGHSTRKSYEWVIVGVSTGLGLIVAAALYLVLRLVRARGNLRKKQALLLSNSVATYTFKELRNATRNFKEVIGKGGSSTVYRGVVGVTEVAVKDMSRGDPGAEQQFLEELNVISQVRHQNLVALRGWCRQGEKLLLVYEFMSSGSLDKLLFRNSEKTQTQDLGWTQRLTIIKSVAEGLNYLHEGLGKRIVHRDIKAANVLLDDRLNAKLGDFGLARLMNNTVGDQTMTKAGTLGYISPELAYTGRATEKSDVYGFGILVLEIVAGRRCVETRLARVDEDRVVLLDWVWRMYEDGRLMEEVVDEKMGDVDDEQSLAVKVLELGLVCCSFDAGERPSMRTCCQVLSGEATLPPLARERPRVSMQLSESDHSYSSSIILHSRSESSYQSR